MNLLVLAFKKQKQIKEKEWLKNYNEEIILDYGLKETKIEDFINKEFIHFSNSDCLRSIGNCIDGFKVSQRKYSFPV